MPRLLALKPREVEQILQRAGFVFEKQKGSHRMYLKGRIGVVVPWHNKDLKKGTLRKIISDAGFTVEEFLTLR